MKRFVVRKSGPLKGTVRVPSDKSIGHRALIFSAIADGVCTIDGLSGGLDNLSTAQAFREMGVQVDYDAKAQRAVVHGVGLRGLRMARGVIDCGNSGTTMRLLAGLLSAQHFGSRLVGDGSLMKRPMKRIIHPLRARGAHIAGTAGPSKKDPSQEDLYPPISIAPLLEDELLAPVEYEMPVSSAQVKSALLLSGLYASGLTALSEPIISRDHTERMMTALGVPLQTMGSMVVLDPTGWRRGWDAFDWQIPGDLSAAAFMICVALMVEGSDVQVENVCVNPTRTGLLDALRPMGVRLGIQSRGDAAGSEPVAQISASHGPLRATKTGGEVLTRMIDEVPVFAALAACAQGRTEIRDAQELRVKESDRIATMVTALRAFGVDCTELDDGMLLTGGSALRGGVVESHGDHRIAMSGVLLGLVADGETIVNDVQCVDTSFPNFAQTLRSLGAHVQEESV